MATNKHAIIRYQTLDKCFRNPGRIYYIEDLVEACNDAINEYSGIEDGLKRRQLLEDINLWKVSKVGIYRLIISVMGIKSIFATKI